jgi:putative peptidoglycan lipid II flippase
VPALLALFLLGRLAIRLLFEHGKFDAAAGDLTYQVLSVYAVALPAYVTTELVTRGLIALRDTRTPLFTNIFQLIARTLLMALLLERFDVLAIPAAFAISATMETLLLSAILLWKLQMRIKT